MSPTAEPATPDLCHSMAWKARGMNARSLIQSSSHPLPLAKLEGKEQASPLTTGRVSSWLEAGWRGWRLDLTHLKKTSSTKSKVCCQPNMKIIFWCFKSV
jgi:hypothetical protein